MGKGLKRFSQAAVMSAAILSALSGCATPWRVVQSNWYSTGGRERIYDKSDYDEELTRKFDISIPYLNKIYKTRIDELSTQKKYETKHFKDREPVREVAIEQREVDYLTIPLALGGTILGTAITSAIPTGNDYVVKTKDKAGVILAGAGLGFFGGLLLGISLPKIPEVRTNNTGRTDYDIFPGSSARSYTGEVVKYQRKAVNINAEMSAEGKTAKVRTDSNGELNLSDFIESLNSGYFFRSAYFSSNDSSRSELEKRIKNIPIIKDIKPQTLEVLMDDIVDGLSGKNITVDITTKEGSSQSYETIINVSKSFIISGGELSNNTVYGIIKKFVDREINSRINSLTFNVKDITTHIPIKNSNFNTDVEAPSKEELLSQYFTGALIEDCKRFVLDYLRGAELSEGLGDKVVFYVYTPAKVSLEITNPNYKYVGGEVLVDKDIKKTVEMVDKGDKLRVEGETNAAGKIE